MADSATASGGRMAPTVSAVQLDKRTLDAIIAGVAAQLLGPGIGEGVTPNHWKTFTKRSSGRVAHRRQT